MIRPADNNDISAWIFFFLAVLLCSGVCLRVSVATINLHCNRCKLEKHLESADLCQAIFLDSSKCVSI